MYFACEMAALTPEERRRHHALVGQLASAVVSRAEIADGYSFRIRAGGMSPEDIRQWLSLEQRCCPFFRLDFDGQFVVTMEGPDGIKPFIEAELPQLFTS